MSAVLRRLRAASANRGATLPELSVSMLILGVVVAATATMAIGFERSNARNVVLQDQVDTGRTVAERMAKTVRTAIKPNQLAACSETVCDVDAFISASPFGMQFYANLDNPGNAVGPSRVTYTVASSGPDAGVLVEKVQVPDDPEPSPDYRYCNAESPTASSACRARLTVRRLAEGVVTEPGSPLFRYFDKDGAPMTLAPGAALSGDQIDKVLAVELTVRVRADSALATGPTTYIQRVLLPNSQAVLRPGKSEDE